MNNLQWVKIGRNSFKEGDRYMGLKNQEGRVKAWFKIKKLKEGYPAPNWLLKLLMGNK